MRVAYRLWIAFKNYYLRDTTQLHIKILGIPQRCELLSKIIIFVTRHNSYMVIMVNGTVVNCFQKLLSSWHDTTTWFIYSTYKRLWIAFKNYYLRDTTQPTIAKPTRFPGCELLSKIIIFVTRHNFYKIINFCRSVVNCFQKLLSSWHDTTLFLVCIALAELWIAFKNYYLRDTTQPYLKTNRNKLSCELLSKIIIFVTRHNFSVCSPSVAVVVNCFQKLLSSWHDTTPVTLNYNRL